MSNVRDRGCEGCKFLERRDTGYSNWTVTGSAIDCLRNLNPHTPLCDEDVESAKFEAALAFGETCSSRVAGEGPWFDVDGEVTADDYKDDPDLYALLTDPPARPQTLEDENP